LALLIAAATLRQYTKFGLPRSYMAALAFAASSARSGPNVSINREAIRWTRSDEGTADRGGSDGGGSGFRAGARGGSVGCG
jgi:uncharacterized membrane protein YgcG